MMEEKRAQEGYRHEEKLRNEKARKQERQNVPGRNETGKMGRNIRQEKSGKPCFH